MLDDCPFLSAVFFLVLSVYCFLSPIYCLLLSAFCFLPFAFCLLLFAFCFLSPAYCLLLSDFSTGRNHLEIAIMLGFWYSEVNFRGVIETDIKEFKIGVENELRKNHIFRDVIEKLKEELIKKGRKKYFITIALSFRKQGIIFGDGGEGLGVFWCGGGAIS